MALGLKERTDTVRVAVYCRVSTNSEDQNNSFENQKKTYTAMIAAKRNWIFSGMYADRGLSGTQAKKRPQFMKMIEDAKAGKFDYIIMKGVSRFARNTLNALEYVYELRKYNVYIWFDEDDADTADVANDFSLTVQFALAQAESQDISASTAAGFRERFKRNEVAPKRVYGYKHEPEYFTIVPEEAEVIRKIFDWYVHGEPPTQMVGWLQEMAPDKRWNVNRILQITTNECYMGDRILQKSYTEDYLTHKRIKNTDERYGYRYIENDHEGIVSRETFQMAKTIREMRNAHNGCWQYPYGERLKCPHCGKPLEHGSMHRLYFGRGFFMGGWGCYREDGCRSYLILDEYLNEAMLEALKNWDWKRRKKTVEYYWLDELVEDIKLEETGLTVKWKDGRSTSAEFTPAHPLQKPSNSAEQYNGYLNRVRNGQVKQMRKSVMGL